MRASVFAVLLSSAAFAQGGSGYQVEIPRSRIDISPTEVSSATRPPGQLDFGVSSWVPSGFSLPGRINGATSFARTGVPTLYINYLTALGSGDGLFAKTGLSWVELARSGSIGENGASVRQTQAVEFVSARLGAEYSPESWRVLASRAYLGAALLPSFALTGRSAFDDGSLYFGVPLEWSAGTQIELSRAGIPWSAAYFDLGVSGTIGTIYHSSVAGVGIKGGIRVSL